MKSPRKERASSPKAHNLVDPDLQKLFLVHRDAYVAAKKRVDNAGNAMRTLAKTIKGDGFTVDQIKDAVWLSTPEGEAAFKVEMANRMLAAAYIGADIGEQLSLFLDEPRVPAVDRAYKEGQACAMRNEAAIPKYDPSTDQHQAFMKGYHEEQERQVKAGIGKLEDNKGAANGKAPKVLRGSKGAPKAARARRKAAEAVAKPASGKPRGRPPKAAGAASGDATAPITRAGLAAAKDAEPDSYFSKSKVAGNA